MQQGQIYEICYTRCAERCIPSVCVMAASSVGECEKTGGSLCQADNRCLSNSSVCDGVVDCSDASDELHCSGVNLSRVVS